jgi:hypothetical protein
MTSGKRKAPEGTGADAITRHHQPESYTEPPIIRDEEQLTLWPDSIPAHRLHPAEADMRRVVNTAPRRKRRSVA